VGVIKDYSINALGIMGPSFIETIRKRLNQSEGIAYLTSNAIAQVVVSTIAIKMNRFISNIREEVDIVHADGYIRKCFDEWTEDQILISDLLRKVLLAQLQNTTAVGGDGKSGQPFTAQERQTIEYKLFKIMCLGGQICQFEDFIQPYFEMSNLCYSQFIPNPADTEAFEVLPLSPDCRLFESHHQKNYCLVAIDRLHKLASVLFQSENCYY
jgi:cilia- and flagella-associated protein 300